MSEPQARKRCSICGKPADARYRPFCSRRCAAIDLGRWFSESYAVPEQEPDEASSEENDEG